MAAPFLFSNFAVSALQSAVGTGDTALVIATADAARFPTISPGSMYPVILQDSEGAVDPEICYVTAAAGGSLTVLRARESTSAKAWLAGTLVIHTFTAASLVALAKLRPLGTWSNIISYEPNDVVVHDNISYVSITTNLNSEPSDDSVDWMVLYQPPGEASGSLSWQGKWDLDVRYPKGSVVHRAGRLWYADLASLGQVPSDASPYWTDVAPWSGATQFAFVLNFIGTDNYTAAVSNAVENEPSGLYDGMRFLGYFQNTNTGACTATIGDLDPIPLNKRQGIPMAAGDIVAGELYEFVYLVATDEAIVLQLPGATNTAGATVPLGGIIIWSGAIVDMPVGWALCNGQTLTRSDGAGNIVAPDLRGRFVVGAGGSYSVGGTGGATSVTPTMVAAGDHTHTGFVGAHTLTLADIPVHSHTGTTDLDGTHEHNYTAPATTTADTSGVGVIWGLSTAAVTTGGGVHQHGFTTATAGGGGSHTHSVSSDGSHIHSINPFNILPPYYALAYIMRY